MANCDRKAVNKNEKLWETKRKHSTDSRLWAQVTEQVRF
jgi:hypothetical protein